MRAQEESHGLCRTDDLTEAEKTLLDGSEGRGSSSVAQAGMEARAGNLQEWNRTVTEVRYWGSGVEKGNRKLLSDKEVKDQVSSLGNEAWHS